MKVPNRIKKVVKRAVKSPNAKPKVYNKELSSQLVGTRFSFGKPNQSVFTNDFTLGEDFKITGYQDDNEYSWNVYQTTLEISDIKGNVTSKFDLSSGNLDLIKGQSTKWDDVKFELIKQSRMIYKFDKAVKDNNEKIKIKATESEYLTEIKNEFRIQNIVFPQSSDEKGHKRELFYRGDEVVSFGNFNIVDGYSDFNTYINSLSLSKWTKYTTANKFFLKLSVKGQFELEVIQNYLTYNDKNIQEKGIESVFEELHQSDVDDVFARNVMNFQSGNSRITNSITRYNFNFDKVTELILPVTTNIKNAMVGFTVIGNAEIHDAGWYTSVSKTNPVDIVINTTTFQKEKYILKNLSNIKEKIIDFENKAKGLNQLGEGHLFINVVDNGRTLDAEHINNEFIRVYGNPNVGGAGGFSRGMIETLNLQKNGEYHPTHVIFMDDDIEVLPESFKRVFALLSLVKEEYKDYFIEGAMLDSLDGITQYEDTGFISRNKDIVYFPVKDRYNQTDLHHVLRNDLEYPVSNEYGAWWYCTVPIKYIHEKSMSLPIFYRGDDIEFSVRNDAKFITLNGLAVWHLPFYTKKSKALENYLVPRNSFIDQSVNGFVSDVNYVEKYIELYKKELRMFNYGAADQVLDALDDYLKGPEYVASLDGIKTLQKEGKKNEKFDTEIPDEIKGNLHTVDEYWPLNPGDMQLFNDTDNGHGLPEIVLNQNDDELENVAIVNQDMLDNPGKQFMRKRVVVYDTYNKGYAIRERSQETYEELETRRKALIEKYNEIGEAVAENYREHAEIFHSQDFWKEHLGINAK
ncbi:glycosyltransferase family 2 protein [Lactococcus lactis]|uniref:glycosyltransferase family 2 protein n=1 Tax=Lactococcus lactis TaxID=1358 RepID=UPI002072DA0F|nr:hypothetical protein [Lactococcus lactis]